MTLPAEGGSPPASPPPNPQPEAKPASQPPATPPETPGDVLKEVAASLLAEVPDHLKGLIPEGLDEAGKIRWFQKAKQTGVFGVAKGAAVPVTDSGKAPITPRDADFSKLPVYARMAAGYRPSK